MADVGRTIRFRTLPSVVISASANPSESASFSSTGHRKTKAAAVGGFSARLFGRHIKHGAQQLTVACQARGLFTVETRERQLGEAEIENFYVAVAAHHNVFRLQVAVDDSRLMRGLQSFQDLPNDLNRLCGGQAVADERANRLSFNKFGDDKLPADFASEFVNGQDMRMIESGSSPGLTTEALKGLRVSSYLVGQKLKGDKAAQMRVFCLVDNSH